MSVESCSLTPAASHLLSASPLANEPTKLEKWEG